MTLTAKIKGLKHLSSDTGFNVTKNLLWYIKSWNAKRRNLCVFKFKYQKEDNVYVQLGKLVFLIWNQNTLSHFPLTSASGPFERARSGCGPLLPINVAIFNFKSLVNARVFLKDSLVKGPQLNLNVCIYVHKKSVALKSLISSHTNPACMERVSLRPPPGLVPIASSYGYLRE